MTTLQTLARWVRTLGDGDLPPDALRLARLQHLAAAGTVRASRATAWCASGAGARLVAGGSVEADAATHGGLYALRCWDDWVPGGRTGIGVIPSAWAHAGDAPLGRLLAATVAGNEVGGRVGLATLLAPRADRTDTRPAAGGGAAAGALLTGLDAETTATALALALEHAACVPLADLVDDDAAAAVGSEPARAAVRAVARARNERADTALLDPGSAFYGADCFHPLHRAYDGLGETWLTRGLVLKRFPGMAWGSVALEAVDEILGRHVKAAEKRLRADQVERVEVRVGAFPWAMERAAAARDGLDAVTVAWSISRAIGVLVANHALGPAELEPDALAARAEDVLGVSSRVEVVHDWKLTVAMLRGVAPLLGELSMDGWGALVAGMGRHGLTPPVRAADLRAMVAARPWSVVPTLRGGGAPAWELPVQVKLYTTRGGWWPERRAVPRGTLAAGDAEAVARARWTGGDPARDARADALLAAPPHTPAREWLAELLA